MLFFKLICFSLARRLLNISYNYYCFKYTIINSNARFNFYAFIHQNIFKKRLIQTKGSRFIFLIKILYLFLIS